MRHVRGGYLQDSARKKSSSIFVQLLTNDAKFFGFIILNSEHKNDYKIYQSLRILNFNTYSTKVQLGDSAQQASLTSRYIYP